MAFATLFGLGISAALLSGKDLHSMGNFILDYVLQSGETLPVCDFLQNFTCCK